ncbi:hypothetical protein BDU57DRAFT_115006 [Ampelomyces quisqualis]|uniref:Uncharacterized protein n=1 Tax=Ampelomyces quisqualis TaxID=50730 RepID=A0A6A5Q644_AMPQU|nr:hypothetical protein BDU57DRAFT_115006 [Ampelomyces quisqualis]
MFPDSVSSFIEKVPRIMLYMVVPSLVALAMTFTVFSRSASFRTLVAIAMLIPPPVLLLIHADDCSLSPVATAAHGPGEDGDATFRGATYFTMVGSATVGLLAATFLMLQTSGVLAVLSEMKRALCSWWHGQGWVFGLGWKPNRVDVAGGTWERSPGQGVDASWAEDQETRAYWAWRKAAEEKARAEASSWR